VVTTTDGMPPEVSWREVVVPLNLVNSSVARTAWATTIGQHDSLVPCALERSLATWRRDWRESCSNGWL